MGKSTKSETKQTNEPPAWAKPLLQRSASEGMRLYDEGKGYNVYGGPTQAQFSDPSLAGMNSLLAATGYTGSPVTNQSVFGSQAGGNAAIQQARQQLQQQAQAKAAPAIAAAPNANAALAKKINSNPQFAFLTAMGVPPKALLGDNYEAWASAPATNQQLWSATNKPKSRNVGGRR